MEPRRIGLIHSLSDLQGRPTRWPRLAYSPSATGRPPPRHSSSQPPHSSPLHHTTVATGQLIPILLLAIEDRPDDRSAGLPSSVAFSKTPATLHPGFLYLLFNLLFIERPSVAPSVPFSCAIEYACDVTTRPVKFPGAISEIRTRLLEDCCLHLRNLLNHSVREMAIFVLTVNVLGFCLVTTVVICRITYCGCHQRRMLSSAANGS